MKRLASRNRMAAAFALTAVQCGLAIALSLWPLASFGRASTLIFSDTFDAENGGTGEFNYTGFAKWNVTRGDVDLIGSPGVGDFYPGHGLYVDLDGSPGRGRLTSKALFQLAPGPYRLSFKIGNNPFLGSTLQHNHARVRLADVFSEDFARDGVTPLDSVTRLVTVNNLTSGRLVFESLDESDFAGVVIDDVRLEAVPEPSPLVLSSLGLVLFVATRRIVRRRSGRALQGLSRLLPLMAYATAARPDIFSWQRREIHEVLRRHAAALIEPTSHESLENGHEF